MKQLLAILVLLLSTTGLSLGSPDGTTQEFYDWFIKTDLKYRDNFSQARPYFTDELYGLLSEGFSKGPSDDFWVDFDPFSNSQMGISKVSVGKPTTVSADLAMVPVTPFSSRGETQMDLIKVYLKKVGGDWKIANLSYTGDYPFELKKWLKDGLGK